MSLLNQLFAIILLRGKPQDLPASPSLVWLSAAAAVTSAMAVNLQHVAFVDSALSAFSEAVLLGAVIWGVVALRGYPERWMQTIIPLYAGITLRNLVVLPIVLGGGIQIEPGQIGLSGLVIIGVGLWFLVLMAHVLRHALELGLGVSLLIAFSCLFTLTILLLVMFPLPPLPPVNP